MTPIRYIALLFAGLLVAPAASLAQPLDALDRAEHDTTVVALVDGTPITFGEVRRGFGLEPVWTRGQSRLDAYRDQLERAVADRLMAAEARRQALHRDPYAASRLAFLEEKEAIRELYRREILGQVEVSEVDMQTAYLRSKSKVRLLSSSFADRPSALAHLEALRDDSLSAPLAPMDTTGWLSFYDVSAPFQEVIFDLQEGEAAGPIESGGRFFVVKLLEGERNLFLSEREMAEQQSRLRRTLTEQRAQPLARRYVAEAMEGLDVRLERAGFVALGRALEQELNSGAVELDEAEVRRVEPNLNGDELVVRWNGGSMTAREVLWAISHLPATPLEAGRPVAPQLKAAVGMLVRNQILAERARAKGLDTLAAVRREVSWASDRYLRDRLRDRHRSGIEVDAADVAAFRQDESFEEIDTRLAPELATDDGAVEALLRAHRLTRWEGELIATLRRESAVSVHPETLRDRVRHPEEVLAENPIPMMVREVFQ